MSKTPTQKPIAFKCSLSTLFMNSFLDVWVLIPFVYLYGYSKLSDEFGSSATVLLITTAVILFVLFAYAAFNFYYLEIEISEKGMRVRELVQTKYSGFVKWDEIKGVRRGRFLYPNWIRVYHKPKGKGKFPSSCSRRYLDFTVSSMNYSFLIPLFINRKKSFVNCLIEFCPKDNPLYIYFMQNRQTIK